MALTGSSLLRGLRRLAGVLPLLGALAVGLVILVPALLGYQRYVILTGSMTGTYDRGSLVFDRVVPTASLRTGDVITFQPPGHSGVVTHRIHAIRTVRGKRVFATKGDFNKVPDIWNPFTLRQPRQAKVAFHVPYVGFAVMALSDRRWRMLVIGIPAALIALMTLAALWRDTSPPAEAPEPS
ncbi:MAG: signal peptidase I [Solirubrobacteraceae bacterium]